MLSKDKVVYREFISCTGNPHCTEGKKGHGVYQTSIHWVRRAGGWVGGGGEKEGGHKEMEKEEEEEEGINDTERRESKREREWRKKWMDKRGVERSLAGGGADVHVLKGPQSLQPF